MQDDSPRMPAHINRRGLTALSLCSRLARISTMQRGKDENPANYGLCNPTAWRADHVDERVGPSLVSRSLLGTWSLLGTRPLLGTWPLLGTRPLLETSPVLVIGLTRGRSPRTGARRKAGLAGSGSAAEASRVGRGKRISPVMSTRRRSVRQTPGGRSSPHV
jgi:hypothetical protein